MRTLLLLRHAKSSWKKQRQADHDRPLNQRGKRDAPRMGRLLSDERLVPDRIVSSTAKRARTTALKVADECGYGHAIEVNGDLYLAAPKTQLAVLRDLYYDEPCVMLIGHNPGLESLLYLLTGEDERLPTAALAQISLDIESWADLRENAGGMLVNLWRPKELDDD